MVSSQSHLIKEKKKFLKPKHTATITTTTTTTTATIIYNIFMVYYKLNLIYGIPQLPPTTKKNDNNNNS